MRGKREISNSLDGRETKAAVRAALQTLREVPPDSPSKRPKPATSLKVSRVPNLAEPLECGADRRFRVLCFPKPKIRIAGGKCSFLFF